jgi:tRNA A-37 threonylcarbamoyl transferase component Bud32
MNMEIFWKDPQLCSPQDLKNYLDRDRGEFFFFRHQCLNMQARFAQLFNLQKTPKVFLHGNPHVENYVITAKGASMIDFDRARIGPYAWDIVRFLVSLSLKRAVKNESFLSRAVLEYFLEGYIRAFKAPKQTYKGANLTAEKAEYSVWYENTNDYLAAGTKWVKKMRKRPISPQNKKIKKLVKGYLKSRKEENLLKDYQISEAGKAQGTFGNERYLIVLSTPKKDKNSIFLDIKTVYQDPDNEWFSNPFKHHGLKMLKASKLYAPGIEYRIGFASLKGKEFWGREIPHKCAKIKEKLDEVAQLDIAYSVGTQLGRAHRNSLDKNQKPKDLLKHLRQNYIQLIEVCQILKNEVQIAYQKFRQDAQG